MRTLKQAKALVSLPQCHHFNLSLSPPFQPLIKIKFFAKRWTPPSYMNMPSIILYCFQGLHIYPPHLSAAVFWPLQYHGIASSPYQPHIISPPSPFLHHAIITFHSIRYDTRSCSEIIVISSPQRNVQDHYYLIFPHHILLLEKKTQNLER